MAKHVQGRPLSPDEKYFIVKLKQYFDNNRKTFAVSDPSAQMVSDALDVGLATVNRIVASYNKNPLNLEEKPKAKGRPSHVLDVTLQEIVRAYIRSANLNGEHVTLELIRDLLQKDCKTSEFHISTLARTLDRWGFEFGKGTRTQHLKEKDYVIAARKRYLRKMRANRLENGSVIRPEVYLDESYVNKNHSNDFTWYSGEDGPWIQKPTGNGERLIIMNAITVSGWVPGAKNVFASTRKTGDYHGQMNANTFQKWFAEKLLPNIPKNSYIVLDNAAYHNCLSEDSAPTPNCSKKRIFDWLSANKIPCADDVLKAELIEALIKIAPEPTYVIDVMARQYGHEVIRTPPYHPELQPIEICWGVVKNEVARNCKFTMKDLEEQLENAFSKVTSTTCEKIIEKIRNVEGKFWNEDVKLEKQNELISTQQ
jgi:transposase